jgi:DNA-binding NarL/FixJ family response regulator
LPRYRDDDVAGLVVRVAQGALANVSQHAKANTAVVTLAYLPGGVTLDVADNGVGFDPDLPGPHPERGFGLRAIRQRVAALGGTTIVESAPMEGAMLAVTLPQPGSIVTPGAAAQVRIVLADDHPVVRAGLRALLAAQQDLQVVGEAADGAEAVRLVRQHRPDLVLMDLQLGTGIDGVEATRQITALDAPPRVIVLTTYDSDADILRAVEAGAAGFLLKDSRPEELFQALRGAAAGETVLSPPVASRLVSRVRSPQVALSPREIEILELLAAGASNREISRALFISEATVKTHLAHVYDKLGVDSRTAAVHAAVQRRLIRIA